MPTSKIPFQFDWSHWNIIIEIHAMLKDIKKNQTTLGKEVKQLMSIVDDLQKAVDDQSATLDSMGPVMDAIVADEADLSKQIADLKAIIAAGGNITVAQLQPVLDKANANASKSAAVKAALDAIDAAVPGTQVP